MGGYRARAAKRIKGQRAMKPHNPTVKFTWTKTYQVSSGQQQAGENCYVLQINGATPFNPIQPEHGEWVATEGLLNEPLGLNSDMYRHYKTLVVKGCHVAASVVDNLDASNVSEDETICLGQLSIVRASENQAIGPTMTSIDLKQLYGQKSRDFTLASRGLAVDGLTKSAYCSNGYSAKKTWNSNPNAIDDIRVANQAGSSNTPTDSTYLNVCLVPRFDTNKFLQPTVVSIRITYIIQFQEPTITQTVPLPMKNENQKYKKYVKRKNQQAMYNQTKLAGVAAAAAGIILNRQRYRQRMLRY